METTKKTSVDIVQEMLAIHATHREVTQELKALDLNADVAQRLNIAIQHNNNAITDWLGELSNYGDGLTDNVDRQNAYQLFYKENLDTLRDGATEQKLHIFESLQDCLKQCYKDVIQSGDDLPEAVTTILHSQLSRMDEKG